MMSLAPSLPSIFPWRISVSASSKARLGDRPGLERPPQHGLGPVEVPFPRLQPGQAQREGGVLGIEPMALLEVGPHRGHVPLLLGGHDGRGQDLAIVGGQLRALAMSLSSAGGVRSRAYRQR